MEYFTPDVHFFGMAPSDEREMVKMIEKAGRTCYKSEDKITDESAWSFIEKILKNGHFSVLEHSNICIEMSFNGTGSRERIEEILTNILEETGKSDFFKKYRRSKADDGKNNIIISANLRAWVELISYLDYTETVIYDALSSNLKEFIFNKYYPNILEMCYDHGIFIESILDEKFGILGTELLEIPTQLAELKMNNFDLPIFVFKVITDRGVSHEIVRSRTLQYSQESTRYVNYWKKVGIMFYDLSDRIYLDDNIDEDTEVDIEDALSKFFSDCENMYNWLVGENKHSSKYLPPQIARNVLPHSLRTEIVISGRWGKDYSNNSKIDLSNAWCHFIRIRSGSGAHPYIKIISDQIHEGFLNFELNAFE